MKRVINFAKKEAVACISFVMALVSMAFVPIDSKYIGYIDLHTLVLLLGLMIIMAGLRELNVFFVIGRWMLNKTRSVRSIALVLVGLCFVFSMVITNDVALITFVPFTIEVLMMAGLEKYLIRIIVLQTVASNLGSMFTPIGNPQNLYLFSLSNQSLGSFIAMMLPYALLSLVGLIFACIILTQKGNAVTGIKTEDRVVTLDKGKVLIYLLLFLFALIAVANILPEYMVFTVIFAVVLFMDFKILKKPDYSLLLTFVFLFIFIGNMKRIEVINSWLYTIIHGNELITSVLASQFISNVPAAVLLSGFTDNIKALIVGTNLGGLGTIIASMASLISFKYYSATKGKSNPEFLFMFTLINVIFLLMLLGLYYLIN